MKPRARYINTNKSTNPGTSEPTICASPGSMSEFVASLTEDERRIVRTISSKDPCASRLIEAYAVTKPGTQMATQVANWNDLSWMTGGSWQYGGYPRQNFSFWGNTYHSAVGTASSVATVLGIGEAANAPVTDQPAQPQGAAELVVEIEEVVQVRDTVLRDLEAVPAPQTACYLLSLVLSPRDREVIVGDLIEEYRTYMVPEFGERRANLWFWTQTGRSVWPILSRRLVRVMSGAALVRAFTHMLKWF